MTPFEGDAKARDACPTWFAGSPDGRTRPFPGETRRRRAAPRRQRSHAGWFALACAIRGRAVKDRHHGETSSVEKVGRGQRDQRLVLGHEPLRDHEPRGVADRSAAKFLPAHIVTIPNAIFARKFDNPKLTKRVPTCWGDRRRVVRW